MVRALNRIVWLSFRYLAEFTMISQMTLKSYTQVTRILLIEWGIKTGSGAPLRLALKREKRDWWKNALTISLDTIIWRTQICSKLFSVWEKNFRYSLLFLRLNAIKLLPLDRASILYSTKMKSNTLMMNL